jgi:hypothetical protein
MRRYYSSRYGGGVLTAVGLIPGAPVLLPELSGSSPSEVDAVGTFRGYGADVAVSLTSTASGAPDVRMPLPLLIGAWVRTQAAPRTDARAVLVSPDTSPTEANRRGLSLFEELESSANREGLLVVADGSTMLTARAPGAFHADAPEFQRKLDLAIEEGDWHKIDALDPAVCAEFGAGPGRAPLQVMSAVLAKLNAKTNAGEYFAPFGVGYHVRTWTR